MNLKSYCYITISLVLAAIGFYSQILSVFLSVQLRFAEYYLLTQVESGCRNMFHIGNGYNRKIGDPNGCCSLQLGQYRYEST